MSIPISARAETLKAIFQNPVFLSSVTSWFFAQLVKAAATLFRRRWKSPRDILKTLFWHTGGMPSSHAAVVSSMTVAAAFSEGLGSSLFGVCVFFAMVVMRDAMGVRRATGLQARSLNQLGREVSEKLGVDFHPVKEIQGHDPLEVVVGALLGIFIAAAFAWL
ncbi:MAG: divergent PAP2 family protein [Treponema sp.]|jgi:acid phosphatase family membrane protein YuiD|nr:divergent PAP2 family protein [Treponema sp.]